MLLRLFIDGAWKSVDSKEWSEAHESDGGGDSQVQQHFRDEVDVNTIVKRFGITGQMPFGSAQGVYGDFSGIRDYDDALAMIEDADRRFMSLPAEVREKFSNDPGVLIRKAQEMEEGEFMEFVTIPKPEIQEA